MDLPSGVVLVQPPFPLFPLPSPAPLFRFCLPVPLLLPFGCLAGSGRYSDEWLSAGRFRPTVSKQSGVVRCLSLTMGSSHAAFSAWHPYG